MRKRRAYFPPPLCACCAISFIRLRSCALYLVWVNGGSRNLALGLGALVGSFAIFVLQIAFELKSASTRSFILLQLPLSPMRLFNHKRPGFEIRDSVYGAPF